MWIFGGAWSTRSRLREGLHRGPANREAVSPERLAYADDMGGDFKMGSVQETGVEDVDRVFNGHDRHLYWLYLTIQAQKYPQEETL